MMQSVQVEAQRSDNVGAARTQDQRVLMGKLWASLFVFVAVVLVIFVIMAPASPAAITAGAHASSKFSPGFASFGTKPKGSTATSFRPAQWASPSMNVAPFANSQEQAAADDRMNANNVGYGLAASHELGRASSSAAVPNLPKYDELASVSIPGFTFFISDEVERLTSDMGKVGSEMKQHVQGSYELAKRLLSLNQKAVDDLSEALLHKATVSGEEFAQIMRHNGVAVWEQDFNFLGKMDLLDWAPDLQKSTATKVAAVGAALLLSSSPAFADAVPTFGRFSDDAMPNVATYVLAVDSSDLGLNGIIDGWKGASRLSKTAGAFRLPPLPYDYKALEPNVPEATMKLHYEKYFSQYLDGLNKNVEDLKKEGVEIAGLIELQKEAPKEGQAFRDNAGGFYNHGLFFESMTPDAKKSQPSTIFANAVDESFGSMDNMKSEFGFQARKIKGSGWAWLGVLPDGKLAVTATDGQDNPLMEGTRARKMIPIMGLDMQKHAYQFKFKENKDAWINAWWDIVNWGKVSDYYEDYGAMQKPVVWKGAEQGSWQANYAADGPNRNTQGDFAVGSAPGQK